ncbi:hypothetical protein AB0M95_22215 [Sphaerisporangium sp. NPDC051017]|uniref:hypothetical protein n=1 Tax=Sphaerisporangium sp. NPDC051017 TaxID=3154636 RepID=UPI00342A1346
MKRLILLYPPRWRRRYGDEMSRLIDDLGPTSLRARLSVGADLLRGAFDAHLAKEARMTRDTRMAVRRGVLVALVVWGALSVEIVLSNVVFPTTGDDDGLAVLVSYLCVFAAPAFTGVLAARTTTGPRGLAAAGAIAGALVGALTVTTYLVIDNVFLDTIGRQQSKIDGLAHSGMTSMRAYVNVNLLFALAALTIFLGVAGAGLSVASGLIARARRAAKNARTV